MTIAIHPVRSYSIGGNPPPEPTEPYDWQDVEAFLSEAAVYVATSFDAYAAPLALDRLGDLQAAALYCTDQAQLKQAVAVAGAVLSTSVSPDQQQAHTMGASANATYQPLWLKASVAIDTYMQIQNALAADEYIAKQILQAILWTIPKGQQAALISQLQAAADNLSTASSKIDALASQMPPLRTTFQQATDQWNTLLQEVNAVGNDPTKDKPLLNQIAADLQALEQTSLAFDKNYAQTLVDIHSAQSDFSSAESGLIAVREQIPSDLPVTAPPKSMNLDISYLLALFTHNTDPTTALSNYVQRLKNAGITQINLDYFQLCDAVTITSPNDTFAPWAQSPQYASFLETLSKAGMLLGVRIGGPRATTASTIDPKTQKTLFPDWKLPSDPANSASALAAKLKAWKTTTVDFDISVDITQAGLAADYLTFFSQLHQELAGTIQVHLTVPANVAWPESTLAFLFEGNAFFTLFDAINLKAYSLSDGNYQLSVQDKTFGIAAWIRILGGVASMPKIHVLFEENINYFLGESVTNQLTNGGSASVRMTDLLSELIDNGFPITLGGVGFVNDYSIHPPDTVGGNLPAPIFEEAFSTYYAHWLQLNSRS